MPDYSLEQLQEMKATDIRSAELEKLVDIRDISIEVNQPAAKKIQSFVEQAGNPYCYRYGEYVVKIGFSGAGVTMEERLKEYVDRVFVAKKH